MKFTLKNSLLFLAVCMMSIVACSDDDEGTTPSDNNNNNGNGGGNGGDTTTTEMVLKATVDTSMRDFDDIRVSISSGKFSIIGVLDVDSTTTERITFSIPVDADEQSYPLPQSTQFSVNYKINNTNYTSATGSGSLTITTNDTTNKHLAGTFNVTVNSILEGDLDLSNGEFDLNYE